jgi:hypothetical protein
MIAVPDFDEHYDYYCVRRRLSERKVCPLIGAQYVIIFNLTYRDPVKNVTRITCETEDNKCVRIGYVRVVYSCELVVKKSYSVKPIIAAVPSINM